MIDQFDWVTGLCATEVVSGLATHNCNSESFNPGIVFTFIIKLFHFAHNCLITYVDHSTGGWP